MGWKIVRDNDEAVCKALGISGQWRPSAAPHLGLTKKLFEEAAEFAESGDPAELYDLRDVLNELIDRLGSREYLKAHIAKRDRRGLFTKCLEWTPVPEGQDRTEDGEGHPDA